MTNRMSWLTVVLDKEYREDDVQKIVDSIEMIKGVSAVKPNVNNGHDYFAKEKAKQELREKIGKLLYED